MESECGSDSESVIGGVILDRFLSVFGIVVFLGSLIFLVMSFFGESDGVTLIVSIFGLLNASIAIGVSDILSELKKSKR